MYFPKKKFAFCETLHFTTFPRILVFGSYKRTVQPYSYVRWDIE